jgi:hypothetical protein
VDLDVHVSQDLEEAYTVVRAARAGQRDDEPSTGRHLSPRLRRGVALAPHERPPQADLNQLSQLARMWAPSRRRLVVHDLIIEGDLEDAFGAALQLETEQDWGPTVENLCCPTDSIIQVVSRDAVFDDDVVLWVDHLVAITSSAPAVFHSGRAQARSASTVSRHISSVWSGWARLNTAPDSRRA